MKLGTSLPILGDKLPFRNDTLEATVKRQSCRMCEKRLHPRLGPTSHATVVRGHESCNNFILEEVGLFIRILLTIVRSPG